MTQVLQRVAELADDLISELDAVSVTLLERSGPRTVVFSGSLAAFLDERQYEEGFGPCLDAAASGDTVIVDTTDSGGPYPTFALIAAQHGIRHSLSVGLPLAPEHGGALTCTPPPDARRPPAEEPVTLAESLADFAAVAVAGAGLQPPAAEEARHLRAAVHAWAVIDQAKGIVMATRRCTPEQAFALLARAAQQQNRGLQAVATDLVARWQDPAATP